MRPPRLLLVLLVASVWSIASSAQAGDFDGELALDYFRAENRAAGPGTGSPPNRYTAQDFGQRLRLNANQGPFSVAVDYHGREPLSGTVKNSTLRLLYSAYAEWDAIPGELDVRVGRFLAPSQIFLPVDGGQVTWRRDRLSLSAFGGRRGITTSRKNVPIGEYLPAAGASAEWSNDWIQTEAAIAYAGDQAILIQASENETRDYDVWNGYLNAFFRPRRDVYVNGHVSFAQQANYVLGPTWGALDLNVETVDLWNGVANLQYRPWRSLRLLYDFQTQRAGVYRAGVVQNTGPDGQPVFTATPPTQPRFTDNRFRLQWSFFDLGWLRPYVRLRNRPDWNERRYGISGFVDRVPKVEYWKVLGSFFYDDIVPEGGKQVPFASDRLFWAAAIGYERWGFDTEIGGSRVRRFDPPYSGRLFNVDQPTQPDEPRDLAPFVLQTQTIAFVRTFYVNGDWFAGADFELNLEDTSEIRFFLQLGVRVEETF